MNDVTSPQVHKPYVRIAAVAVAALCITLIAKALASLTVLLHGHETGFDATVGLLLHYTEVLPGIVAFLFVNYFVLVATLILEPSRLGIWIRKRTVVPSLQVSEHMLSLAIGVTLAQAVIEVPAWQFSWLGALKSLILAAYIVVSLGGLALSAQWTSQFFDLKYDAAAPLLGRHRFTVTILVACLLFGFFYWELVWQAAGLLTKLKP